MSEYNFQFDYVKREEKRKKALKEEAKKESLKEATFSVTDVFSAQDSLTDIISMIANKKPANQLALLVSEALISGIDEAAFNYAGANEDKAVVLSNKFKKQLIMALRNSI